MKKHLSSLFCAVFVLFVFVFALIGCSEKQEAEKDGISVVATLFPQYDFARAILGEKGSATLLLPPGADSHNFELTPADMKTINNCNVFIYTGPDMEIWVDSITKSISKDVSVINLSENIKINGENSNAREHDHAHAHVDPHIWTSPKNALQMLSDIYDAICKADSENAEYYKTNYDVYVNELTQIDREFQAIATEAKNDCLYFSGKFAFEHFVTEYGLSYVAPFNSCSDVEIESLAAINNLITQLNDNNVSYVFYEELSNNKILDTIVSQTNAKPLLLHSAHNVSKTDFENGVTYISLMKQNAQNLRKALIDG